VRDADEHPLREVRLHRALDDSPLGHAAVSLDGRIVYANRALARALGRDDLTRLRLDALTHPDEALADARATLALLRGDDANFQAERRLRCADGAWRWFSLSAVALRDDDGVPTHLLVTAVDISAPRRDREALVAAREEAERSARARASFLANVTHELRTPLHAVLGFGRVLDRGTYGPLTERQREYLGHLLESGEHMLGLVDALLDLRRVEDGSTELRREPIDARDVIERAARMLEPLAQARAQSLRVEVASELSAAVGDAGALLQCLTNLLTNAVKFTPEGGHVSVRAAARQGRVAIDVEDDGPGIAATERDRVFEYLEQARAEVPASLRGSGIGLALTRALVRHMDGTLTLRSAPGRGSVFTLTLRAAPREAPA
jgi:PAS domain S-box-containing protein